MKTSYFAKSKKTEGAVSIAIGTPWWAQMPKYVELAPSWEMVQELKAEGNIELYTERFYDQILGKLSAEKIYIDLEHAILLCWEKYDKFCHRRLVAQWIKSELGIFVPEIDYVGEDELYANI
jgi:hypothetical protein